MDIMDMHGYVGIAMYVWPCMGIYGHLWIFMAMYGYVFMWVYAGCKKAEKS